MGLVCGDRRCRIVGSGVPWLAVNLTSGIIWNGETLPVEVVLDASAISPGSYSANICG